MNKGITLAVAFGSVVYLSNGGTLHLTAVPENGWELLEKGATYLKLDKESEDELKTWEKARLEKFLELRKSQGFDSDVKLIEKVIKNFPKNKKKDPVTN
jgi:hypothetical protein